jgi:hypothetical protein
MFVWSCSVVAKRTIAYGIIGKQAIASANPDGGTIRLGSNIVMLNAGVHNVLHEPKFKVQ